MPDTTWTGMQEAAGLNTLPGFLAGTPVAVLAGFNLATAILVVSQRPSPDRWAIWASSSSACFFLGAAAFLVTMALSGRAQFLTLDPAQAAAWWPEMALDTVSLARVRNRVWESQKRVADLIKKASFIWIGGLALTAAGAGSGVLSYSINLGHWLAAGALLLGAGVVALVVLSPLNLGKNTDAAPPLSERAKKLLLRPQPQDIPALTVALGDGFVSHPLLTPSSRTIREFAQLFPTEDQQMVFRLACQKLAHEFGGYSTTRTSVLFTVKLQDDSREQVIVAIHPIWSEVDERGVPFEVSPKLIAMRTGSTLAQVEKRLESFPKFPFQSAGCRLLCGPLTVDVLARIVKSH